MGARTHSAKAVDDVVNQAKKAGSASHKGEERERQGLGLDPLVDPAGYGLIRRSISFKEKVGKRFKLVRKVAMAVENLLDDTGSMAKNVELALNQLNLQFNLLTKQALIGYDVHIANALTSDVRDPYVLRRTQFEMDEQVANQLTLMVPQGGGCGNGKEDPQYGLFGSAYLTAAEINRYGLKRYVFAVSDEPIVTHFDADTLVRIYGPEVFAKAKENGHPISKAKLPTVQTACQTLLEEAFVFFIQIGTGYEPTVSETWGEVLGEERIVKISSTKHLAQVQAVLIGLTEGTLKLSGVEAFLQAAEVDEKDAKAIRRAVSGIPCIGEQARHPNFGKLPGPGSIFAKRDDLWPIEVEAEETTDEQSDTADDGMWS